MFRLFFAVFTLILLTFNGVTFVSCKKEAKSDYCSDTVYIANVLQPDNLAGKDAIIENNVYKIFRPN